MIFFILSLSGSIPWIANSYHIMYVGFGLEAILFAFAIGDKMNVLRSENEIIRKEKLLLVEKQNEELDRLVKIKTQEVIFGRKTN